MEGENLNQTNNSTAPNRNEVNYNSTYKPRGGRGFKNVN
jgi:hypothetical protein